MSSTDTSDLGMYKMMGFVALALTLFTLICIFGARMLAGDSHDPTDVLMRNALIERIQPVGQVRTKAEDGAQAAVVVAAAPMSEEDLYNGGCAACHAAGVANAPKLDDTEAWAERNTAGLEALVSSVINGKGAMPARGGSTYSDEDIERVVKYMTGL